MNPTLPPQYPLGHADHELERLNLQARIIEPSTRQVFQQAGLSAGMRVLDVGCGCGDVAFLAAELVGPSGQVVGVDRVATAVALARAHAQSRGAGNVTFLEGDPAEMQFDGQFDAVVGRLILMYYPDPAGTVRKLAVRVRDGGLVVFQDLDIANCRSLPRAPTFDHCFSWIKQTLLATGASTQLGLELYRVFLDAGLPGPSMRMDSLIGGGPDCPVYELITGLVRSMLPVMERLQIATAAEVGILNLAQRIRDEVVARRGVVLYPALIGAWSRKIS
jgi:2-polyprenyl-3-methyl-5-hydroxy-6-metoxy-1,4-benzoquinol methylase